MKDDFIEIREMRLEDCELISRAFAAQGWNKPVAQYQTYWEEMQAGKRFVLVAECNHQFAGYVTIVWESDYPPFREVGIPEIMDFNVLIKNQRRGIGTRLMDEAETPIVMHSPIAGIGVGLTPDYGAAQILYVKRGYIPDGRGVFQHGRYLKATDQVIVDNLVLYLRKNVWQK